MPSLFSVSKMNIFVGLSLLLFSSSIQAKPASNLRSSTPQTLSEDPESGCWIQSYGRGVGKPVNTCPNGLENDASLCYTPCRSGFAGNGPVCWQQCPDGYENNGAYCLKPKAYGRGTGYSLAHQKKCENENPQGCEKNGLLYYPKCRDGFHAFGCCICTPDCPNGMTDIGVSCQKQSYGRGVGKPLVCNSNQEEDAALCYNNCKDGWNGKGPVCWGTCPAGMYQCGALCVENGMACATSMLEIANKVMEGMNEAGEEDDNEGKAIDIGKTGVDVGNDLAKYGMCKNM